MSSKLTLALLGTTLVFAQNGPTRPDPAAQAQMHINMLASRLSLTDAQKTSAVAIYTNAYTAEQTVQASTRTARQSLNDAVKKNDLAAIDQASATLGTLSGQTTAINSKADAAFYALLTTAQQTLFDSIPRGGGPGGPGRPGPMRGPRN
jgi:Spy/CpxP family protein refolding chaperone